MKLVASLIALVTLFVASFTGTYKGKIEGQDAVLTLKQNGTSLSGDVKVAGITINLTGTVDGNSASGNVSIMGEKAPFKATLSGKTIKIKVADVDDNGKPNWDDADEMEFTSDSEAAPANDEQGSAEPIKPSKSNNGVTPAASLTTTGKEYTHSSGGKFRYPANWTVTEAEGGVRLTPPDATENEVYLITGESAEGATDPASKEVAEYVNSSLQAAIPNAQRSGGIGSAPAGNGKGAVYTWTADSNGTKLEIKAFVTILKGFGVAVVGIAPPDIMKKREPVLRSIFYSLGWGQAKTNPQLVGVWKHWSYSATSGTEKRATAELRADGTFTVNWNGESSGNFSGKNQYGDTTWVGGTYSNSSSASSGTWFVNGNELTLNYGDGSTDTYRFEFANENGNVFLRLYGDDPKKPLEWSRG